MILRRSNAMNPDCPLHLFHHRELESLPLWLVCSFSS